LITLFQQGEVKAFDVIYERYFIQLVNLAYKKTGHLESSQELVQDIFLSLHKLLPTLKKDTVLENYLFIALKNRVLNYHRQLLNNLKKERAFLQDLPDSSKPSDLQLEAKELDALLQAGIQALPNQCRTVFLLSREDRLSNKEVAERLNISVNTVEQHMRKALRLLRSTLGSDLAVLLIMISLKK
jgi:RNA polymerase sigma-70 factor (family 1)